MNSPYPSSGQDHRRETLDSAGKESQKGTAQTEKTLAPAQQDYQPGARVRLDVVEDTLKVAA